MFADGTVFTPPKTPRSAATKKGATRREAQLNLLGAVQQNTAQNSLLSSIQSPASVTRWIQAQKWLARCPFWRVYLQCLTYRRVAARNFVFYSKTGHAEG